MYKLSEIPALLNMSSAQAARKIGVSRQAFRDMCSVKKFRLETLEKIMRGLDVIAITSEPDQHYFKLTIDKDIKKMLTLKNIKTAVKELDNDSETLLYANPIVTQAINNIYYNAKEKHPTLNSNDLAVIIFVELKYIMFQIVQLEKACEEL